MIFKARWQSGHAAACKAVYAGSIPTLASIEPVTRRLIWSRDVMKNPINPEHNLKLSCPRLSGDSIALTGVLRWGMSHLQG